MTTIVRGNWTGRIIKKGSECLGRWNYIEFKGKDLRIIKVISTYRVYNQKMQVDYAQYTSNSKQT